MPCHSLLLFPAANQLSLSPGSWGFVVDRLHTGVITFQPPNVVPRTEWRVLNCPFETGATVKTDKSEPVCSLPLW